MCVKGWTSDARRGRICHEHISTEICRDMVSVRSTRQQEQQQHRESGQTGRRAEARRDAARTGLSLCPVRRARSSALLIVTGGATSIALVDSIVSVRSTARRRPDLTSGLNGHQTPHCSSRQVGVQEQWWPVPRPPPHCRAMPVFPLSIFVLFVRATVVVCVCYWR